MWAEFDFDMLCAKLKERDNFSLSRWGDGEWSCVLGRDGRNCDDHPYAKDLSLALATVLLQDQRYYMGMQSKAMRDMGDEITRWVRHHGVQIEWCDADIIHDASIADRLDEMYDAMSARKKILVGPSILEPMATKLRAHHVVTPIRNVWKWTFPTIYTDATEQLDKDCVVLYCCSMATEVMIDKVNREYGDTVTQIDIGSAFDPYCNVRSRRYHQQIIERISR